MNFIPCRLEQAGDRLDVRLTDKIVFAVPEDRVQRYRPYVGKGDMIFGIRPEHLTEGKVNGEKNVGPFDCRARGDRAHGQRDHGFLQHRRQGGVWPRQPEFRAREGATMKMAASPREHAP